MYSVYSIAESEVITNICLNFVTLNLSLFLCKVEQRIYLQGLLLCPMTAYDTAYIQVCKQMCVTCCPLRNFACNSLVGLVKHEEYTARE